MLCGCAQVHSRLGCRAISNGWGIRKAVDICRCQSRRQCVIKQPERIRTNLCPPRMKFVLCIYGRTVKGAHAVTQSTSVLHNVTQAIPKALFCRRENFDLQQYPREQAFIIPEATAGEGRLNPKLFMKNHENMGKLVLCTVFLLICFFAYFRSIFLYFQKEEECMPAISL